MLVIQNRGSTIAKGTLKGIENDQKQTRTIEEQAANETKANLKDNEEDKSANNAYYDRKENATIQYIHNN